MVKHTGISIDVLLKAVSGTIAWKREAGQVDSPSGMVLSEIGEPQELDNHGVMFVIADAFLKAVPTANAKVIVLNEKLRPRLEELFPGKSLGALVSSGCEVVIFSPDAYAGLAAYSEEIYRTDPIRFDSAIDPKFRQTPGGAWVHETARVADDAVLAPGVSIGMHSIVESGVVLHSGVSIANHVVVGAKTTLFPNVVVYSGTTIGKSCRLHANVVLGGDGFGYASTPRGPRKIWHLGAVKIGDSVEIGPGSTVDRGTIRDTVIESGAKIDNQVQIGHNGYVKSFAILCAQVGLAGNVTVGSGAILAGKVGVADKLSIGDMAIVGPMSGLSKDVPKGEVVMGQTPAKNRREWWRQLAMIDRIPDLFERVSKIEKEMRGENE